MARSHQHQDTVNDMPSLQIVVILFIWCVSDLDWMHIQMPRVSLLLTRNIYAAPSTCSVLRHHPAGQGFMAPLTCAASDVGLPLQQQAAAGQPLLR